jgi:hypothetical protein
MGIFEKLMKRMAEYYARECGGIVWKGQAVDSKHSGAPLRGQKTGKNPTDRGKLGAKINLLLLLLLDGRGAPSRSYSPEPTPRQGLNHGNLALTRKKASFELDRSSGVALRRQYRPSDRDHLTNGLDSPGLALAHPCSPPL